MYNCCTKKTFLIEYFKLSVFLAIKGEDNKITFNLFANMSYSQSILDLHKKG